MMVAKYFLEVTRDESGKMNFRSENEGFNMIEVYGILGWKVQDIRDQIHGIVPAPEKVERKVVVNGKDTKNEND